MRCPRIVAVSRAYYGDAGLMRALLTVPGRAAGRDEIGEQGPGRSRAGG